MGRFIKKILIYVSIILMVVMIPSIAVDPYNVFHWKHIRNNGVEPNKNYVKTKYILDNTDKFNGFIFGSSRVGSLHPERIKELNVYNMTYSCGTPGENYETLQEFIAAGVDVKLVIMGVDSTSYTETYESHNKMQLRATYKYLKDNPDAFFNKYFDPVMVCNSMETIRQGNDIEGFEAFYDYGWNLDYNHKQKENWDRSEVFMGKYFALNETLNDISKMVSLCKDNDIELIVFTNPMYKTTYEASLDKSYGFFLKELAKITPYYNFSGINKYTDDDQYFVDGSHYIAEVGDIMIDTMLYGYIDPVAYGQGFGVVVDEEKVDSFLNSLGIEDLSYEE